MNFTEISIIVGVLVIGGYALYIASESGKKQKAYFENKARDNLLGTLEKLKSEHQCYRVYLRESYPFQGACWVPSNIQTMTNQVISNCTKGNEGGDVYSVSEFSINVNEIAKKIHYVLDQTDFDFSGISNEKNS